MAFQKVIKFIGRHLWAIIIACYASLWVIDKPLWQKINAKVTSFFHDATEETRSAREDLNELKKDITK